MMQPAVCAFLALAAGLAAANLEVPAGTEIQIRLESKVASNSSKAKDAVSAMVIAPVLVDGRMLVPGGAKVTGEVKEARAASQTGDRAMVDLHFAQVEIGKSKTALTAQVSGVDNARESVDENGQIQGIVSSETLSSRIDQGLAKLQEKYGGLAGVLQAAKGAIVKESVPDIVYDAGVEMTLKLTAALQIPESVAAQASGPKLAPVAEEDKLAEMVNQQPFRTNAQKPPLPSDMTNLMFIGTEQQVTGAFEAAGWSTAEALSSKSKLETARAIIEDRGYKEAPVSVLMLDGHPPDLVFEKQNDTFAQRHHLRIWRRPVTFQGAPVWVCAATHDIGIDFSPEDRTFIHKIDSKIDRERSKVVNDLVGTGKVKSLELVERPGVPEHSRNATGDDLETDAAMAVVIF
jgi:hypothetical protein